MRDVGIRFPDIIEFKLKTEVEPHVRLDKPLITRILRINIGFIYNFSEVANGEEIHTKKIRVIRAIRGQSHR